MKVSNLKVYHIALILAFIGLVIALIFLVLMNNDDESKLEVNFVMTSLEKIMYSENGIDWYESNFNPTINPQNRPSYAKDVNNKPIWFIGTSASGGVDKSIAFSENGKNWKYVTGDNFTTECKSVAYGLSSNKINKMWVAVGKGGTCAGNIMWSNDTQNWNSSESYGASFLYIGNDVAYGTSNGVSPLWVAVGGRGGTCAGNILYSENGKLWHQSDSTGSSFSYEGLTVAYGLSSNGQPLWTAGGVDLNNNFRNVLYSNNGKKWFVSDEGLSFADSCQSLTFGKTDTGICLFIGVGRQKDPKLHTILRTSNGKNLERTFGASFYDPGDTDDEQGTGVIYKNFEGNKGRWVAVGDPGTGTSQNVDNSAILYSDNGISWKNSNYKFNIPIYGGVTSNTLLYSMNQELI